MILLNFSHEEVNEGILVTINSSIDLRERELSLSVSLKSGAIVFADWTLSFEDFSPITVPVESVIATRDRTLIKMRDVIGTTFVYKGTEFHTIGKTNGYSIVEGKIKGLSTGDIIEILSPCYKYSMLIKKVKEDSISDATLIVGNGDNQIRRSFIG